MFKAPAPICILTTVHALGRLNSSPSNKLFPDLGLWNWVSGAFLCKSVVQSENMHGLSPSHTVLRLSVSLIVSRGHCLHSSTFLLCQFGNLAFRSGLDVVDSGLQSLSQENVTHFKHPAVHGIFDAPIHLMISGMSLLRSSWSSSRRFCYVIWLSEAMSTSLCETSTPPRYQQVVLSWQCWRARPSQLCCAMQVDKMTSHFTWGTFYVPKKAILALRFSKFKFSFDQLVLVWLERVTDPALHAVPWFKYSFASASLFASKILLTL